MVSPTEAGPRLRAVDRVAQQPAGEHQQVVELERALGAPLLGAVEHETADVPSEPSDAAEQHRGDPLLHTLGRGEQRIAASFSVPTFSLSPSPNVASTAASSWADRTRSAQACHSSMRFPDVVVDVARPGPDAVHRPRRPGSSRGSRRPTPPGRAGRGGPGVPDRARLEPVPVVLQLLGHDAEVVRSDPLGRAHPERSGAVGVFEEGVDEDPQRSAKFTSRADLVQDLDPGREPGLDGAFAQEPLRERVQRADRGAVDVVDGPRGAVCDRRVIVTPSRFEF